MTDDEKLARGVALLPELRQQEKSTREDGYKKLSFSLLKLQSLIAALEAAERISKPAIAAIKPEKE